MLAAYTFCLRVALLMLGLLGVLFFIGAPALLGLFRDDPEVLRIGVAALRFQCASMPLQAYIMMGQFLTQSHRLRRPGGRDRHGPAGVVLIPNYLLLPLFMQITGITSAQFFSDIFTFILTFFIMRGVLRDIRGKAAEEEQGGQEATNA